MLFDFFSPIEALRKISPQKAEKNIDESYSYLANDFKGVAAIFEKCDPLEILKLSLWDERKTLMEKKRDDAKIESAVLLPIILESVLLSSYVEKTGVERSVSSSLWSRLKSLCDDSLRRITRIIENKTALFLSSGFSNEDGENYRNIIRAYLLPYQVDKVALKKASTLLRTLLEEKKELINKIGVDSDTFWINLDNIAAKSLNGIDDLVSRIQCYRDEYSLALSKKKDEIEGKSEEEIFDMITTENGWENRAEGLAMERDGFDMFALSSLSSLSPSVFSPFTASSGTLDIISLLKMGYWPAMRFPFVEYGGAVYTFVGKHIPSFIALSSSFSRRNASISDVLKIFYRIGVDTYTYDGNSIDISVLPSFYDRNIFCDPALYDLIKKSRNEESSLRVEYGHKRLIVDPDEEEEEKEKNGVLFISSLFMAEASRDRNKKHELISHLLGNLEFPEKTNEYKVIDEDELEEEVVSSFDEDDDLITDEYEYDNGEDEKNIEEEELPLPEYELVKKVDIKKEEERYALTDEILKKDEENSIEEEKFEEELDDDIFDDTEEEERLDVLGEKEESEYFLDLESDEGVKDDTEKEASLDAEEEATSYDESQLDFLDLLDEDEEEKEERIIDEELEKEDEEEFKKEEEDSISLEDDTFILPSQDEMNDKRESSYSDEEKLSSLEDDIENEETTSDGNASCDEVNPSPIDEDTNSDLINSSVDEEEISEIDAERKINASEENDEEKSVPCGDSAPSEEKSFSDMSHSAFLESDDIIEEKDPDHENNEESLEKEVLEMEESEENKVELPSKSEETEVKEDLPISGIVYDIYRSLGPSSFFASFLRKEDSETLKELESVIENSWNRMQSDGKDKLFNVAEYSFSILLSRDHIRDDLRLSELMNNAGGVMYVHSADEWRAVILYINSSFVLEDAMERKLTKDSFSPSDWKRVTYIGEQMKKR